MLSSPLSYFLWFAGGIFLPLATVHCMRQRKLHEGYPIFLTYNAFQAVGSLLLFGIERFATQESYFFAYWVNLALGIGLGFFVIREVFSNMLKPYAGLRDAGMLLFRWAAVLLFMFSAVSYVSGRGSGLARLVREITVMERNMLLIQCGLLLFVVMCSNHLNISWKSFPCGVAFGFGIFALNDLVVSNMFVSRGWILSQNAITLISQAVWVVSTTLWFSYAAMPQRERKALHQLVYRPVVDRWNQAAMLLMNTAGAAPAPHTYLSDIERTVETVLAHSSAK